MKSCHDLIPYVPTPEEKIAIIIKFSKVKKGMKTVDLGAGDAELLLPWPKLERRRTARINR